VDGTTYIKTYSYDTYSNIISTSYPSGVVVNNTYDINGGLLSVSGGDPWNPVTLFTANAVNGFGQYTNYTLGNGRTSQNTYNYGIPIRFYTPGIQDLNLTFNYNNGNLTSRYDAIKGLTETFQYDNLNRLTGSTVNSVQQLNIGYDGTGSFSMGNITSKTDAGNYVYNNNKIHAVAYITNPAGPTAPPVSHPSVQQQITYTPFLKTASITEGNVQTNFTYGPDYQRIKTEMYVSGSLNTKKYFFGGYEKIESGGTTKYIHYIAAGNGLCAVIEKYVGGNSIFHFIYTDYLGSLLTRTDINGNITAEQNFDAWGRQRNTSTWQYNGVGISPLFFDRGYTGHEHLPYHYLINMNGRMYDPIMGRMLSPDNYVPDPLHTQGYNRYTYVNNNPLVYTDPDGNNPIVVAAIVGAIFGAYTGGSIANNGQLNPFRWDWNSGKTWGYVLGGAIIGAASGYLGATVAMSGVPLANTAGILSSSFFNSVAMNMLTGGQMPVSVSFGAGSYNFQSEELSYLGKKGNSSLENIGFAFGALANIQDGFAGFKSRGEVTVQAVMEKGKTVSHSVIYSADGKVDISVVAATSRGRIDPEITGLKRQIKWLLKYAKTGDGTHWDGYERVGPKFKLYNVNKSRLEVLTERIKAGLSIDGSSTLRYGGLFNGCMAQTTRALWHIGVFTLPNFHPYMLNAQLFLRKAGIYASPFLTNR
jgi:RHS repeat-associated protein